MVEWTTFGVSNAEPRVLFELVAHVTPEADRTL
jgi:hypothetical protein